MSPVAIPRHNTSGVLPRLAAKKEPARNAMRLPRSSLPMLLAGSIIASGANSAPPIVPVVEAEYPVYHLDDPGNGAGPLWCLGSTCLARRGADVFASGLELIPNQRPLNNVRWTLF